MSDERIYEDIALADDASRRWKQELGINEIRDEGMFRHGFLRGLEQGRAELARVRRERDALLEHWPQYYESESINGVVELNDTWWVEGADRVGGFASKAEAIRHYIAALAPKGATP